MPPFIPVLQGILNGGCVTVYDRKIKLLSHVTWNNCERALKSAQSFFLLLYCFLHKNSLPFRMELGVAFEWRL